MIQVSELITFYLAARDCVFENTWREFDTSIVNDLIATGFELYNP